MNKIKECRVAAGMKQTELAKLLNVGASTISNWETGYSAPDIESLKVMAKALEVSIDELLGVEKAPTVEADGERKVIDISKLNPANQDRVEDYISLLLATQDKK